ncbi:unnamed protein product, partial [Arabidopsis halleri]
EDSPELCLIIDDRLKSGLTKAAAMKKIKSENIPITKVIKLSKLKTDYKNWTQHVEKACGSAMFFIRIGTCSVIKVGKLSMEINEITENVMATLNGVVELLSNKWKYVSSLHLKLSKSLALPIYQSVPDLKLKIDAFATGKSVVKEEK